MFDWFWNKFSRDMAMDLGTANTLIYIQGQGIVVNEPSVVVIDERSEEVLSVGKEAKKMYGKTPKNISAIRPMKDGRIADFEVTKHMIRHFISQANNNRRTLVRPRMIIGVPSGITTVEKKAVIDSAEQCGIREAFLVEEPMAAAIGANLPVSEPVGCMIVDIGGGTTDIAVISMTGVVQSKSISIAGDEIDEAIVQYFRRQHGIVIGLNAAETIKFDLGSAYPMERERNMEVCGIDLTQGIPRNVTVADSDIREGIRGPLQEIVYAVRDILEQTPPDLVSDIVEYGITLTGGGSILQGMDMLIAKELQIKVNLASDPLLSVVLGTGKIMEDQQLLRKVAVN